ncbi:MAG: CheR family methyltransferase [Gammaproteobacteria bacterium]
MHASARPVITTAEFAQFARFIYDAAGITMSEAKKTLVGGRLAKRLDHWQVSTYAEYFKILQGGDTLEVQTAIDLLTTNETYFFREPKHFELLRERALAARAGQGPFRVWSAACSSGEECYSIAMVLADCLGTRGAWEVLGTDICTRVLRRAQAAHYRLDRASHVPQAYLKKYCLKGQGSQQGTLLVERALRERVRFGQVNLNTTLPQLGQFDLVFLRNVMIYFSSDTKQAVVARIAATLKPDGRLVIGHAESLNDIAGIGAVVAPVATSVYRRAA